MKQRDTILIISYLSLCDALIPLVVFSTDPMSRPKLCMYDNMSFDVMAKDCFRSRLSCSWEFNLDLVNTCIEVHKA